MSSFTDGSAKCLCGEVYNINLCSYTVNKSQNTKEINLRQILQFWSIEDMDGFRSGVRERIEELITKKKETAVRRVAFKKKRQLEKEFKIENKKIYKKSLDQEKWREYNYTGKVYRINNPREIHLYKGCTTHTIVDSEGILRMFPAPGFQGCHITIKLKDSKNSV